ncbi:MAG: NADH-quinone oxidoreductase subunit C [Candidatus Bathyarchaeota archaeon]|nr:NADH-quinone oxidoreductase subunit C [Candidatus Bathyarchaeota archaeon]
MTKGIAKENQIVDKVKEVIGKSVLEIEIPRPRRIFILIDKKAFGKATHYLTKKMRFSHVSTITGVDVGKEIEVIYHLNRGGTIELSLKVRVAKDKPVLPTIIDLIPGATLYEREVHDLLGVTFEGHPDLSPIILPEGWPPDVYPLRKEWTLKKVQKRIMKGGKQ